MKIINQHILHKVNLEINTTSEPKAFELKSRIDSFLKENFIPGMEHLLDQLVSSDEIKRFNSINLEINMKPTQNLNQITELLVSQLTEKIAEAGSEQTQKLESKHSSMFLVEKQSNMESAFLHFLETGQLPWYAQESMLNEFLQPDLFNLSLQDHLFILKIKQLFIASQTALERFVQQFDKQIIEQLIRHLCHGKNIDTKEVLINISKHNPNLKYLLYKLIINGLIHSVYQITQREYRQLHHEIHDGSRRGQPAKKRNDQIQEILSLANLDTSGFSSILESADFSSKPLLLPDSNLSQSIQREITDDPNTELESDFANKSNVGQTAKNIDLKAIYIQNAGLILTHPFLWDFLSHTKCTDGANKLLPEKKQYAAHLLHYLGTGREQEMEYNLTFEKFLCGIPLDSPVTRRIVILEKDKAESDELLRSIISHWPVLKNTSPDGIRQMFFQRSGKLNLQKAPFKLNVERKAQDVLLDQLQWNISIVKLPWLNDLLFVEW